MQSKINKGIYWDKPWTLVEKTGYKYSPLTKNGKWTGTIRIREDRLDIPLKIKKPTVFAVWNDLFHEKVPFTFVDVAHVIMFGRPQHTFLILTKRSKRLADYMNEHQPVFLSTSDNVWHGVTCENQQRANERIPELLKIPGKKFLSLEPLLDEIRLDGQFDWVIVGCETGPRRHPCEIEWIRSIVQKCKDAGVPVFVKAVNINGKVSNDISEWPEDLRVRKLPWKEKEGR